MGNDVACVFFHINDLEMMAASFFLLALFFCFSHKTGPILCMQFVGVVVSLLELATGLLTCVRWEVPSSVQGLSSLPHSWMWRFVLAADLSSVPAR